MVYKKGRDFRIGLEIPCNLPFPAAAKLGVRENSSQGNHVTNIILAHFFWMFSLLFGVWSFLQLSSGLARYAEETTLCHNKSRSPVSKEIGILASHSQDIPVVASAFAHTKSSDGLLDVVNKSFGLHLRIELWNVMRWKWTLTTRMTVLFVEMHCVFLNFAMYSNTLG